MIITILPFYLRNWANYYILEILFFMTDFLFFLLKKKYIYISFFFTKLVRGREITSGFVYLLHDDFIKKDRTHLFAQIYITSYTEHQNVARIKTKREKTNSNIIQTEDSIEAS